MITHAAVVSTELRSLIRKGYISFAGNKRLKIYALLKCRSGKRMNIQNRVFFISLQEAVDAGYRPCAHCMRQAYDEWKKQNN